MATLSATGGVKSVSLTGSGHSGSVVIVNVEFSTAGRRFNEMRAVPVVAGAINVSIPVPFGGTVTARALDAAEAAIVAAAAPVTVT